MEEVVLLLKGIDSGSETMKLVLGRAQAIAEPPMSIAMYMISASLAVLAVAELITC